nr:DeoR/GlpR family DNA-binding transcription regulator [Lactiplantibacillus pentosus]
MRRDLKVLTEERQQYILNTIRFKGIIKIKDICSETNCSESTARRDLQQLEEQGELLRVHGGAKYMNSLQEEPAMNDKVSRNVNAKDHIAQQAVANIQIDDVIYLDAGTSTLAMIHHLNPSYNLRVVTNGVVHASALADVGIQTYLLGGNLKGTTKAVIGPEAVKSLEEYRFNKVFLGINGVHPKFGLTTPDPDEAVVKKTAILQSEESFILADNTKFDHVSFARVGDLSSATIITDQLTPSVAEQYQPLTTIQEVQS